MNSEMENLLNRLDELMMEAHEKGYSFVFDTVDEEDMSISTVMYSAIPTFGIDIIEWN